MAHGAADVQQPPDISGSRSCTTTQPDATTTWGIPYRWSSMVVGFERMVMDNRLQTLGTKSCHPDKPFNIEIKSPELFGDFANSTAYVNATAEAVVELVRVIDAQERVQVSRLLIERRFVEQRLIRIFIRR